MLLAIRGSANRTTSYFAAADAVARGRLERRAGTINAARLKRVTAREHGAYPFGA
jgi:hypothetical protein